jgi:hypothetical protein
MGRSEVEIALNLQRLAPIAFTSAATTFDKKLLPFHTPTQK